MLGAHGFDAVERASTGEHRHPPEELLLRCREQRVTPVDRRSQGLLPVWTVSLSGGEDVEGMVESLQQGFRRQQAYPSSREFDGERQAIQAPAHRHDRGSVVRGEFEAAPGHLRPLDEQGDARIGHQRLRAFNRRLLRQRQRAEGIPPLGLDPEQRPAGGEDPQLRASAHQRGDLGRRRDHLFQVVEQQQGLLVPDQRNDALGLAPAFCLLDAQRIGQGGHEVGGIGNGGQRHEGDPVEES